VNVFFPKSELHSKTCHQLFRALQLGPNALPLPPDLRLVGI